MPREPLLGRSSVVFYAHVITSQALLKWVPGPQSRRREGPPYMDPNCRSKGGQQSGGLGASRSRGRGWRWERGRLVNGHSGLRAVPGPLTVSRESRFPPLLLHPQPTPLPEPTQALRPCLDLLPLCITCEPVRAPFCSPTPPPICVPLPKSGCSSSACRSWEKPPPPQRPTHASLPGSLP